jgi:hypothetical protein
MDRRRRPIRWRVVPLALALILGLADLRAAHAASDRPTILIDNSERVHGRSPLGPRWIGQLDRLFAVSEHVATARLPGQNQDFRLTDAILAGHILVILTGFSGSATVGDSGGQREVSYDFTGEELLALDRYVRGGGALLLLPVPQGRPNNLGALLARFGFALSDADATSGAGPGASQGQPSLVGFAATLRGHDYHLAVDRWRYPLRAAPGGATILATDAAGRALAAVAPVGAGRVAFLGLPQLSDGDSGDQIAFLGDNPAFFLALVAAAAGVREPGPADSTQAIWSLRVDGLAWAIFGTAPRQRPAPAEWAAALQAAAEVGRRCDLGPGCVPWSPTAEQRAALVERRAAQDAMVAAFERLESAAGREAWADDAGQAALERDYPALVATLAEEQRQRQGFADLYRRQGGAYPRYPDESSLALLGGVAAFIAPPALLIALLYGLRGAWRRVRRAA